MVNIINWFKRIFSFNFRLTEKIDELVKKAENLKNTIDGTFLKGAEKFDFVFNNILFYLSNIGKGLKDETLKEKIEIEVKKIKKGVK